MFDDPVTEEQEARWNAEYLDDEGYWMALLAAIDDAAE